MMQKTVQLEKRTSKGEVEPAELVTVSRPVMLGTFVGVGLELFEAKALLTTLPENMAQSHVDEYATFRRIFSHCRMLQPLKNRRTWRVQTLFSTVEVEAPRFWGLYRLPAPIAAQVHKGEGQGIRDPLHAEDLGKPAKQGQGIVSPIRHKARSARS